MDDTMTHLAEVGMAPDPEADDIAEIVQLLERVRTSWSTGLFDDLVEAFHPEMVIAAPGFEARVSGRDACIQSYRDFMGAATVTAYEESQPIVDVWGDTAVATFRWEMGWEMNGQSNREAGHDVMVLSREEGRWWVVWRTIVPGEGAE